MQMRVNFFARCRIAPKLDLGTHEHKELGTNEPDHRSQHWLVHCTPRYVCGHCDTLLETYPSNMHVFCHS